MCEANNKNEWVEHDTHVLLACEAQLPLLLVCDHASNKVPPELENLGMSSVALNGHIGWDIGAGDVARAMGEALQVAVFNQALAEAFDEQQAGRRVVEYLIRKTGQLDKS